MARTRSAARRQQQEGVPPPTPPPPPRPSRVRKSKGPAATAKQPPHIPISTSHPEIDLAVALLGEEPTAAAYEVDEKQQQQQQQDGTATATATAADSGAVDDIPALLAAAQPAMAGLVEALQHALDALQQQGDDDGCSAANAHTAGFEGAFVTLEELHERATLWFDGGSGWRCNGRGVLLGERERWVDTMDAVGMALGRWRRGEVGRIGEDGGRGKKGNGKGKGRGKQGEKRKRGEDGGGGEVGRAAKRGKNGVGAETADGAAGNVGGGDADSDDVLKIEVGGEGAGASEHVGQDEDDDFEIDWDI